MTGMTRWCRPPPYVILKKMPIFIREDDEILLSYNINFYVRKAHIHTLQVEFQLISSELQLDLGYSSSGVETFGTGFRA